MTFLCQKNSHAYNIRYEEEIIITMRVGRHWHRLLREVVDVPYLQVFKARLDEALSNLVLWKMSLPTAGCWNKRVFKVPSNTNHSMILLYEWVT